jgi:hypothetical protein
MSVTQTMKFKTTYIWRAGRFTLLLFVGIELFLRSREQRVIQILEEKSGHELTAGTASSAKIKRSLDKNIMIIGAGLGTTGTHLVFEVTCHLGFPSVHWNFGCLSRDDNHEIRQTYSKHELLRNAIQRMKRCVHERQDSCGSALNWKSRVLDLINGLVQDGSIQALHDSPYPNLIPHLLRAANRFNKTAFLVLSERDPEEYARRRIGKSYGLGNPICKKPAPIDLENLSGGGFDLVGCIIHAAAQSDNPSTLDLVDVFTSFGNLVNSPSTRNGIQVIANETKIYQDMIRRKADFSYNMFEQGDRTKVETLAAAIETKVPALWNTQKPARFVNIWKNTELGDKMPHF